MLQTKLLECARPCVQELRRQGWVTADKQRLKNDITLLFFFTGLQYYILYMYINILVTIYYL